MLPELEAAQNMLKYLHHHAKQELEGLDEEGLNWTPPGVDAVNSIYGLALHIASSQVSFATGLAVPGGSLGNVVRLFLVYFLLIEVMKLLRINTTRKHRPVSRCKGVGGRFVSKITDITRRCYRLFGKDFGSNTKGTNRPGR